MRENLLIIGRGIGQVMFQNNALSGLLMLIGIACNSWILAILALAGNIISTVTAFLSKYSQNDIRNGLYGFNGTLVGIAIGVFMKINIWSILILAFASALSTWITYLFNCQNKVPGYTAPFILSVWFLLVLCHYLFPSLLLPPVETTIEQTPHLFHSFCLNIGQVMFQGSNILAGLFFLIAILVNSRLNAIYTIWGAILPLALALVPAINFTEFNAGLLGYNGVLCAIAVGDKSIKGALLAILAVVLSIGLQVGGIHLGLITLTCPFVLATWIAKIRL